MDQTDDLKQYSKPDALQAPPSEAPPSEEASQKGIRRFPRFHTSLFVRGEGEENLKEFRGNVSTGGFCFQAAGADDLVAGKAVELLFRLPGAGIWISARGVILGSNQGEEKQGIRGCFTEIDQGSLALLNQWECFISRLRGEA